MSYRDEDDLSHLSNDELRRLAEEPDNAQASGRFREERAAACRALKERGYNDMEVSQISAGTYNK